MLLMTGDEEKEMFDLSIQQIIDRATVGEYAIPQVQELVDAFSIHNEVDFIRLIGELIKVKSTERIWPGLDIDERKSWRYNFALKYIKDMIVYECGKDFDYAKFAIYMQLQILTEIKKDPERCRHCGEILYQAVDKTRKE